MLNANFVCVVIALICFFWAFLNRPNNLALSIGWLGMFFYALSGVLK